METCFAYGNETWRGPAARINGAKRIALIGSGTMGIGIGIDILNKTGLGIVLIDISGPALERARQEIGGHFSRAASEGRMLEEDAQACLGRVEYTRDYGSLRDADIVWEIATERLDVKKRIFEELEKNVDPQRLIFIFSNTSSHTTSELAELFKNSLLREKFLTGHGYFPFQVNRLFDVMKGSHSSEEAFLTGILFAEQVLEKKIIALRQEHHGYIADPIFQAMGALVAWDARTAQDIVELPMVFSLLASNPLEVLDRTGHMPFTESSKHMAKALPANDRLRPLYDQGGRAYPAWISELEKSGRTGVNSLEKKGFFLWDGPAGREKPLKVFDPASGDYREIGGSTSGFGSIEHARDPDAERPVLKGREALVDLAQADDRGGESFRRYVLPIMLYGLDLIQDGFASAGDVNTATRVGLRYKFGLCEVIDAFLDRLGIDGFIALVERSGGENRDLEHLFDVHGRGGPRKGLPCLLHAMKGKGWATLLAYGRVYATPVGQRNFKTGAMDAYYTDIRWMPPNAKDRVAAIIFDNPLRGNVWNRQVLDQLDHAVGTAVSLYERGELGAILFTASGKGMRMLGADARQFNKGWFDPRRGYRFLGEEEAARFPMAAIKIFRFLQESPIWTVGVFGEKWGGGAEFAYFLNQRFDLVAQGCEFDATTRKLLRREKKNYNQPEIDYAILGGFGAVQELRRLGMGDSIIDEIFLQGMRATRAYQVGLSNGLSEDEHRLLETAYAVARTRQKYSAPYSVALYNLQKRNAFLEGSNDARLASEAAQAFDPDKNPYVSTGLLRLLNRNGKNPSMDLSVRGKLPGWKNTYATLSF